MQNLVEINNKRIFDLTDAQELVKIIFHLTQDSQNQIKLLLAQLENLPETNALQKQFLETKIDETIQRWQNKIEKLGAYPKGLWLVDIDNGYGFYCWKYPEQKISYYHGYNDGFSARIHLDEKDSQDENRHSPDQR